jgi:hypothetical protein
MCAQDARWGAKLVSMDAQNISWGVTLVIRDAFHHKLLPICS